MAGLTEVVERVRTDPAFARAVRDDPRRALEPFDLDADDLRELARWLDDLSGARPRLDDLFE